MDEYIAIAKEKHGYNVEQVCLLLGLLGPLLLSFFTNAENPPYFSKSYEKLIEAYSQF